MKTFDIMEALAEPFRQAGRRPLATIVWGLVGLLPSVGGLALLFYMFGGDVFTQDPDFESGAGTAVFFQFQGWSMLVNLLEWLASIVVIVAVTRATFARRRSDRAFFMRVGADEFRVLIASLVIVVVAILALIVLGLLCFGIGALIWQLPELPRALGLVVLGIAAFLLVLLASGRAYLILPACVWHHSLAFEQGWKLGRRQSWKLVGLLIMLLIVTIVMTLLIMVVAVILLLIIGAILGGWDMPAMDDPEAWVMNMFEQPLVWGIAGAVLLVPLAWVQGFFQLLGNAPFAHVVRELSAEADSAPETPADNPDESL
ncbi:hypothetical protein [Brevundimonas sp.]|uniref:hypothetical protein n=1 Tax=Brevundimonas sp. TaxID=1871086 RepID=UPI001DA0EEB3|nr:hypothetical protein [Brevundimonas sp.]MBL0947108.1 hypothetical protein [Brevundimonas sp.]